MDMELQVCSCRSQSSPSHLIWARGNGWVHNRPTTARPCCRLQWLTPQAKGGMISLITEMVNDSYCLVFPLFFKGQCCYVISQVYSTPLILVLATPAQSTHFSSSFIPFFIVLGCASWTRLSSSGLLGKKKKPCIFSCELWITFPPFPPRICSLFGYQEPSLGNHLRLCTVIDSPKNWTC